MAGADVRHVGQLEQPLHGSVLAEGPVEDRQDDVHLAEGRGDGAGRGGNRQCLAGPCPGACHRVKGGRDTSVSGRELPAPVVADLDLDGLVAGRVERIEDGSGRGDRDLVLARSAAHDHRDADALRHGVVVVVSVLVLVRRPTKIVTTEFGGAFDPPGGSCVWTMPSCVGSATGCDTIWTPKPDAFSCACASLCDKLVTSGTVDVVGPFDTCRLIFVPGG